MRFSCTSKYAHIWMHIRPSRMKLKKNNTKRVLNGFTLSKSWCHCSCSRLRIFFSNFKLWFETKNHDTIAFDYPSIFKLLNYSTHLSIKDICEIFLLKKSTWTSTPTQTWHEGQRELLKLKLNVAEGWTLAKGGL